MEELKTHELKLLEVNKTYQITIRKETGISLLTKRQEKALLVSDRDGTIPGFLF